MEASLEGPTTAWAASRRRLSREVVLEDTRRCPPALLARKLVEEPWVRNPATSSSSSSGLQGQFPELPRGQENSRTVTRHPGAQTTIHSRVCARGFSLSPVLGSSVEKIKRIGSRAAASRRAQSRGSSSRPRARWRVTQQYSTGGKIGGDREWRLQVPGPGASARDTCAICRRCRQARVATGKRQTKSTDFG